MYSTDFPKSALNIAKRASERILLTESPDIPEKAILYALAKNGPMSLVDLVETISTYGDWEANHYTIKRRIKGLANHISLNNYEFVKEREPEIRKQGKYGKIYCLTTKGFLSAFSTGLSFERMDMFKKYTTFLNEILDRKIKYIGNDSGFDSSLDENTKQKILDIITRYIKYQIIVFLIWHEANETSIRKKRNSNWYIEDFFRTHDEFIYQEFPTSLEKKLREEYREILREYFTCSKIIHGLDEFTLSKDTSSKKIRDNFRMINPFVFEWYLYFDELQMRNSIGKQYDIKKIPSLVLSRPEFGIDIEYHGKPGQMKLIQPDIKKKTNDELKQMLRQEIQIDKIWKNHHKKQLSELFAV
jgi:hypothetical protein